MPFHLCRSTLSSLLTAFRPSQLLDRGKESLDVALALKLSVSLSEFLHVDPEHWLIQKSNVINS